jgi:peptidyl-prolyl cis/trans isomerase
MSSINYSNIKSRIERYSCPEHRERPKFTITSDGFTITACCEKFRTSLINEAKSAVEEETQKAIEKMLKNAFK